MPAFRSTDRPPAWCHLEGFNILRLGPGASHRLSRNGRREKLFVVTGACAAFDGAASRLAEEGDVLDLTPGAGAVTLGTGRTPAVLVHAWGRWGEPCGASGVFTLTDSPRPRNAGDSAHYPRRTDFDRHYHDCDEYWIIVEGSALAVSEGLCYTVGPGDCVATGMGHHHDLPMVFAPVRGVYLETTLEGRGRLGHLWEHTHGPAEPRDDRR